MDRRIWAKKIYSVLIISTAIAKSSYLIDIGQKWTENAYEVYNTSLMTDFEHTLVDFCLSEGYDACSLNTYTQNSHQIAG